MLLLCFLIFISHGFVDCDVGCTGMADGNYEITCKSYIECSNGVKTVHNCTGDQMYNMTSKRCGGSSPPCNIDRDCSGLDSKSYPDHETNCQSYYTCSAGTYFGHNFCSPGLVFHEEEQICNWPYNVPAPCGTKLLVG
ncbi:peritrophin-48-like [Argopecten irradians]|uniref:peritrophin-48-like n=1 Tax=Argopecten irradians TaxID=31199 RepID=UPI00371410F7